MRARVTPNAKRDGVSVRDGVLCVKVSCPPKGGKANKREVEVLEKEFHCKVTIAAGLKSREKEIEFGCDEKEIGSKMRELEARLAGS